MTSAKSKMDEFMSMLDNVDQVMPSTRTQQHSIKKPSDQNSYHQESSIDQSRTTVVDPSTRDAYMKARERLVELEIEREDNEKSMILI